MFHYLDNAATTQTRPEAAQAAVTAMTEEWGNPSSRYAFGQEASGRLKEHRAQVAAGLGCRPEEVYFLSCGTEGDNWAIAAAVEKSRRKGKHIITTAIEHAAVLEPIRELEEHYGVRLFERTGRAISPTQAAGALYGYASHIVSLFDDMEKQMRNWDTLGVLRLGASVTIGTHILPDLIRRYQARVPQLRIEALVEQSSGIERKLLDNEIDIGLIETQPEQPELLAIPFLRDELCAIVPLGSALAQKTSVTLRELSEYPFLMREPGSAVRQILDASFSLLQITVHPVWQSASTQAIVSAVAEGLGVAVLPRMLVERDAKEEIVRMLPIDKPLVRELNIVYHRRKFLTRNMQDFIALCREPLEKTKESWDAIRRRREEHEA